MITTRDPTAMSPDARLAELSKLLATGYVRLLAGRITSDPLALPPHVEASCAPMVDTTETEAS